MQQKNTKNLLAPQRLYTAKEVAQYEYCPLVWWHEQYDPAVQADNDSLFAQMVEIEQEYGSLAPEMPDYQVIEQILARRGAFYEDARRAKQFPEMEADEELDEEYDEAVENHPKVRRLLGLAVLALGTGVVLVGFSILTLILK
ncbi:hypothetical protein KDW_27670 [Dictyobacter vulcani]|uniref:Uncharacterized protein n=1 Tax=Dictyobacter vulcani TaxID=2607529 RepID=A0A5J4KL72_9CHLR|nr:hypothetical protein [Dictyobacter vulcani]GER88605.1 hypothetical protein KDW_27670 [Dictyobacter vulcani]